MDVSYSPDV